MSLPVFDYIKVNSLEEASRIAKEKGNQGVIMAGGTDVILLLKEKAIQADTVIDIKGIGGLEDITFVEGEGMKIGALARLFDIQTSEVVKEKIPALADAAHYVASAQIRRKGTMVGNKGKAVREYISGEAGTVFPAASGAASKVDGTGWHSLGGAHIGSCHGDGGRNPVCPGTLGAGKNVKSRAGMSDISARILYLLNFHNLLYFHMVHMIGDCRQIRNKDSAIDGSDQILCRELLQLSADRDTVHAQQIGNHLVTDLLGN